MFFLGDHGIQKILEIRKNNKEVITKVYYSLNEGMLVNSERRA